MFKKLSCSGAEKPLIKATFSDKLKETVRRAEEKGFQPTNYHKAILKLYIVIPDIENNPEKKFVLAAEQMTGTGKSYMCAILGAYYKRLGFSVKIACPNNFLARYSSIRYGGIDTLTYGINATEVYVDFSDFREMDPPKQKEIIFIDECDAYLFMELLYEVRRTDRRSIPCVSPLRRLLHPNV